MTISITLLDSKDSYSIALKLHRQFFHPSNEKLLQLIKKAGEPWWNNQNLMEEINNVSNSCKTCKFCKKTPPASPIFGLPMVTEFQEMIAMA